MYCLRRVRQDVDGIRDSASMKVTLTVTKGRERSRSIEFAEPRGFVIGRAKDADLRLSSGDPYVSRRHVFLDLPPTLPVAESWNNG